MGKTARLPADDERVKKNHHHPRRRRRRRRHHHRRRRRRPRRYDIILDVVIIIIIIFIVIVVVVASMQFWIKQHCSRSTSDAVPNLLYLCGRVGGHGAHNTKKHQRRFTSCW